MNFRILGPLEALDGTRAVALGGSRRRAVLAALLLHRGETLSSERLVDLLWGESAPPNSVKTLQAHVSRLRKELPDGVLVTRDNYDMGINAEDALRETLRGVLTASGQVSENVRYEVSYVYGETKSEITEIDNRFYDQWYAAIDVVEQLVRTYEAGQEQASEHDRHGVFQWWLRQSPTSDELLALVRLSWLDPDATMGGYVRECIAGRQGLSRDVAAAIASPYHRA